ncbi:MAG: Type 1 glutamine amidotransferase-like domain-containing protein [Acidobacteriota bacterium]
MHEPLDAAPDPPLILLGPQRLQPVLRPQLDRLAERGQLGDEPSGPVVAVTAGWQEREGENDELATHLEREVIDLRLHGRTEEVFAADPELAAAHRRRQDRLQELQRLYRYRLDFALEPARELMRRPGDDPLLVAEREAAIDAVRELDRRHLENVEAEHRRFLETWSPAARPEVVRHRDELAQQIEGAAAIAIAGGHVAVLANRLRLFDLVPLLRRRPILAWSAGAMVLARRIVLFHDSPPQGAGNPDVLDQGLGLHDLVPLPHARHRLRLEDPARVALFARRFAPERCTPLDEGMALERHADGAWREVASAYRLDAGGEVVPLEERAP